MQCLKTYIFQNMIEKPEEREVVQENALAMIQCKVLKQLEVLLGQKIEDPDITEDIEFLTENLQKSMVDLRWVAPLKFVFKRDCSLKGKK